MKMKIAFSTLGCPDFSWTDIYTMAKDLGFGGIEIRGLGKNIFAVQAQPFRENQLHETIQKLSSLHLEIPCLSSGCCLKFPEKAEENYYEILQYIQLAAKLGTPFVRILADLEPHPEGDVDDEAVLAQLKQLIPAAEEHGITLLVETNGVYADTTAYAKPPIQPPFHTDEYSFMKAQQFNSCLTGKIAVTTTGDVIPCIFPRRTGVPPSPPVEMHGGPSSRKANGLVGPPWSCLFPNCQLTPPPPAHNTRGFTRNSRSAPAWGRGHSRFPGDPGGQAPGNSRRFYVAALDSFPVRCHHHCRATGQPGATHG
jgi:hypothetical protein